jgi:hypothetical protein
LSRTGPAALDDNFVIAKTYRPAARIKPLPQLAQRELRLAFPKVSGSRWSDRNTTRGVKENLLQRASQAAAPYQARHGDQRMFPRTPMTVGKVPAREYRQWRRSARRAGRAGFSATFPNEISGGRLTPEREPCW